MSRIAHLAALAAMFTLAFAGQALASQDLRSPDARDAALQAAQFSPSTTYQDLRSPDARDAGRAAKQNVPTTYQDLRSPDARDAGRVPSPTPEAVSSPSSDGFNWGYLAIGAGALLLLAGVGMWTRHSLRPHASPSVPTS